MMDDDYPEQKVGLVKLESGLILDSGIEADEAFTVSCRKASDNDRSENFAEQTLAFPGSIEMNMLDSLPSIPKYGSSPREDVTIKIKEEPIEDETQYPESSIDNSEHFSPVLQETSVFPEDLIKVKLEDDLAEENDATEETQRHLYFTENDPEMEVDGLQYKKMCLSSCSEGRGFESFDSPAFGAGVTQKTGKKAAESVFLHSEHFPRISNCELDSENSSVIDSLSVSATSADNVVKHNRISTAQNYTESTPTEATSSELCSAASMPRADFLSLDATISEERPFACDQCSTRCKRKSGLQKHMLIHSNERAFSCDQCSAQFKREYALKRHILTHSDVKIFSAEQCSAQLNYAFNLRQRSSTHSKEKVYACEQCSAQFNRKYYLKLHLLNHPTKKEYICNQCSARFAIKGNFKRHLLIHTNKKPFSCDQCPGQFRRKEYLQQHLLTHTSLETFSCNQCSARLKSKTILRHHLLTHSDKKFSCNQCDTQFETNGGLRVHLLTHSKKSPLTCSQCSAQFQSMFALGGHLLEHLNATASACDQ